MNVTYLDDLLDKVGDPAVGKDLPLGGLVVKQDVECCIFVRVGPLVERAETQQVGKYSA